MIERLIDTISRGGVVMIPILLLSFASLVLVFERWIYYRKVGAKTLEFSAGFFPLWLKDQVEEASSFLEAHPSRLANILKVGLDHRQRKRDEVGEILHEVMLEEMFQLERFLPLIATLATLMPLLGLLGTVTGMISTFDVIRLEGTGDAEKLAGGISEALITTQAGLVAAIPLMLAHTWLSGQMDRIALSFERAITRFTNHL